jgi:multicomponent Na+:H+ antiporter subunit B
VSRTTRLALFGVAAVGLGAVLVIGLAGLPAFGDYRGVYGHVLDGIGVTERHATDLVTALNFDIRGFDTLGEEFILFASVLGVVLILRQLRDEHQHPNQEEVDEHKFVGASEALRALSLVLIPVLLALGVYIVVHGQITPGGGFQGGVILATGPLAVFLAGRYLRMRIVAPQVVV